MEAPCYLPHYRVEDYLQWEGEWELWAGIPVSMSPSPDFWHQQAAGELSYQINDQFRLKGSGCDECFVAHEIDWHVDDDTVVRPDVLVVCGEPPEKFVKRPPVLVAEFLSDSTREKDLTAKRDLYASQGVAFYVIGDPDAKTLVLLRLEGETYVDSDDWHLLLHPECGIELDPAAIYRR